MSLQVTAIDTLSTNKACIRPPLSYYLDMDKAINQVNEQLNNARWESQPTPELDVITASVADRQFGLRRSEVSQEIAGILRDYAITAVRNGGAL